MYRRFPIVILLFTGLCFSFATKEGFAQKKVAYRMLTLSAQEGEVESVNDAGVAVGAQYDADGQPLPYAWSIGVDDSVVAKPLAMGAFSGRANQVCNGGVIAGTWNWTGLPKETRGVVWLNTDKTGIELPLPVGGNYLYSEATAVCETTLPNLKAVVVGFYQELLSGNIVVGTVAAWAIRSDDSATGPFAIETDVVDSTQPYPADINSSLTVVGTARGTAVRWQLVWGGGSLGVVDRRELFAPGSFGRSYAHAINEDGDICGSRYPAGDAPGDIAYLLDNVKSFDEEGNVIFETFVDRPLKHLVETARDSTRTFSARGLNNSNTPQVTGSAYVYRKTTGNIVRNDFPVIWQGTSVTDVQKLVSTSSPIPSYYMPAINDLRWLGGRTVASSVTGYQPLPCLMIPN